MSNLNVIPDSRVKILFLQALNINFLPVLIALNAVGRLLLHYMTSVIVGVIEKMLKLMS